jgi:FlaA1/EpsC-like NDP-sugar epimerase
VGLLFLQQISRGGPVTVTHPDVRRYFLTLGETVGLVLAAAALESPGGVWAPEIGPPLKVLHLAEHLIRNASFTPGDDVPIAFIGLRAGDKMVEQLTSTHESMDNGTISGLRRVTGPQLSLADLETAVAELAEILRRRDLPALIQTLCGVVPEYRPSAGLMELLSSQTIRTQHA